MLVAGPMQAGHGDHQPMALDNQSTVNDIIEHWPEQEKPGYTTILKTLQKMEKKDIVGHRQQGKKYAYFAKITKESITDNRLSTIISRMFSGNKISFAQYFIDAGQFNTDELKELKKLISKKEKEGRFPLFDRESR